MRNVAGSDHRPFYDEDNVMEWLHSQRVNRAFQAEESFFHGWHFYSFRTGSILWDSYAGHARLYAYGEQV